jgi:hypothetical protein
LQFRARIDKVKVQERMKLKGLGSFTELAERGESLGVRTVYRVLDSHTWTSGTLHALADALDCSPFDLLSVDAVSEEKALALASKDQSAAQSPSLVGSRRLHV